MYRLNQKSQTNTIYRSAFLLFIVYCLLLIGNCFSQSITWQRSYNSKYSDSDYGEDVCGADGDNFYIVGASTIPNSTNVTYVLKIDKFGDTIWTRYIPGAWAKAVTRSNDGGCVFTGITDVLPFTIKLSPEGNIVWNRTYGTGNIGFWGHDITNTLDGGYISCATTYYYIGYIFKIDSLGNFQWDKFYHGGYAKYLNCIIEAKDSGYVLVGTERTSQLDTAKGLICKVGFDGNIVWEKTYRIANASTSFHNLYSVDDEYLISGDCYNGSNFSVFFKRVNSNGIEQFTHLFPSTADQFGIKSECLNNNRYIFSIGKQTFVPPIRIYAKLLVTDSTGNVINQKEYHATSDLEIKSIKSLNNTDLLFVGSVEYGSYSDVYALRTDSQLNAPPPIGINNSSQFVAEQYSLEVYPNPFNSAARLKYGLKQSTDLKIVAFDVSGKAFTILNVSKQQAGVHTLVWEPDNLSSGIYFISLYANNKIEKTFKVLFIK